MEHKSGAGDGVARKFLCVQRTCLCLVSETRGKLFLLTGREAIIASEFCPEEGRIIVWSIFAEYIFSLPF